MRLLVPGEKIEELFHLVARLLTTSRLAHVSLRLLGKVHWENVNPRPFLVSPSLPYSCGSPISISLHFPTLEWASIWEPGFSCLLVPHCRKVNPGEKGKECLLLWEMGLRFWWTLGPASDTEAFLQFSHHPSPRPCLLCGRGPRQEIQPRAN